MFASLFHLANIGADRASVSSSEGDRALKRAAAREGQGHLLAWQLVDKNEKELGEYVSVFFYKQAEYRCTII